MKLHRNTVEAILVALKEIFEGEKYADRVIEKVLKSNPKWGARDRAFIAENTYEIVRWWRLILFTIKVEELANPQKYGEGLGFYWRVFGAWCVLNRQELPNWQEFKYIDAKAVQRRYQQAQTERKIMQAIPDWLDELASLELGEQWDSEMTAMNQKAPVILRTNTLKTSPPELQKLLAEDNITTYSFADTAINPAQLPLPYALQLAQRRNIFTSVHFKNGLFEIQDAASQLVAPFLDVQEGMRVVDACAGAGGKTLHLATLMNNKGRVISMDTESWKLDELRKRTARNGISNVEPRVIDSNKVIKRLENSADRLLLDVPCSGLGVLKRNPDAKWKLHPDFITRIKATQAEILGNYVSMLRKDGVLVYATCSILPSEGEEQVRKFLERQDGKFELLAELRTSPAQTGFDGFYMAKLVKKS
jgi:16S rRNA (cytosine967-C5)-methyltransferase